MGKESELLPHTHTQRVPNQFPSPNSLRIRILAFYLSGGGENGGKTYMVAPSQGQLLDPPQFSVPVFPLSPPGAQKETSQDNERQNLNESVE